MIQDEDNSRGQQGVKDLVQSVNDRYRGYANTEEEKEKWDRILFMFMLHTQKIVANIYGASTYLVAP